LPRRTRSRSCAIPATFCFEMGRAHGEERPSRQGTVLPSSRATRRRRMEGIMARRRPLWTLSPDTDRALREACEAATRDIQQTRQQAGADIRRECEAWAQKKYGVSSRTQGFAAARLHAIAMSTLESMRAFTLAPTLVVLQAVKRHVARVGLSQ